MCGIFGLLARDPTCPPQLEVLQSMGDALAHRGPDGGGVYTDGPLGFGMRRLSIIDLKTGDQPLANEDKSVWVVFNGEIYNYRELTAELIQRGHRFTTASDTEVLVHLYEEFGEGSVERLRAGGPSFWLATGLASSRSTTPPHRRGSCSGPSSRRWWLALGSAVTSIRRQLPSICSTGTSGIR